MYKCFKKFKLCKKNVYLFQYAQNTFLFKRVNKIKESIFNLIYDKMLSQKNVWFSKEEKDQCKSSICCKRNVNDFCWALEEGRNGSSPWILKQRLGLGICSVGNTLGFKRAVCWVSSSPSSSS